MEPGNATVLVSDNRVDIWIGDQSPQETRYSASRITGIPEKNVYLHMCHLGGGFGRNGNGPQAEQAIYIANQNRGTPIHLLWTREEDFVGRPIGPWESLAYARRSMPMAGQSPLKSGPPWTRKLLAPSRPSTGPRATTRPAIASRPTAKRFTFPSVRGAAWGSRRMNFYRESFIDELAHAAGKDPYLYRRELISRTNLPYKADMLRALDTAAKMSGWGTPLPQGTARAIALEERGAEGHGHATISAQVHTVSVSKQGEVRLLRVDVAHEEGFGLVIRFRYANSSRARSPGSTTTPCINSANVVDGRIAENNFDRFPLSRIKEDPPENQHHLLQDRALAAWHGSRSRHLASIRHCDAVFQITGSVIGTCRCGTTT